MCQLHAELCSAGSFRTYWMELSSHDAILACVLSAPSLLESGAPRGNSGRPWLGVVVTLVWATSSMHVKRQLGRVVKGPEGLWGSLEVCGDWRLLRSSFPFLLSPLEG